MERESNIVREAIFEIIENQLSDNNPPITKQTYTRLTFEGYSHDETMKLIGCAMTTEIFEIMKNNQAFNEGRYSHNLNNLPDLPWEEK